MRRRRTLSRHQPDPGQGPLPIIIRETVVVLSGIGLVEISWPQPVRLSGLPPFATTGGFPLTAATQLTDSTIQLTFAGGAFAGDILTLPDWTPNLRGLNGEWVAPITTILGDTAAGSFPNLVRVLGMASTASNIVTLSLATPWTAINAPQIAVGGNYPIAFGQTSSTTIDLDYVGFIAPGELWSVPAWMPSGWAAAENAWLAPVEGLTT